MYIGFMKKLVSAANRKDNKELQPWLKSISCHLYWSCSSSAGDKEVKINVLGLYYIWECALFTHMYHNNSNKTKTAVAEGANVCIEHISVIMLFLGMHQTLDLTASPHSWCTSLGGW